MDNEPRQYDLDERLLEYSAAIVRVDPLLAETEELIKIFFVSIRTANKKVVRESPDEPYGTDS